MVSLGKAAPRTNAALINAFALSGAQLVRSKLLGLKEKRKNPFQITSHTSSQHLLP